MLQPDPCKCRPLSTPIRRGCYVGVDKDCIFRPMSASKSTPLQSVFIENRQWRVQIQLFPLMTIVSTHLNSNIFSPNHTHQQLIVAFCLILHSLALSKRNAMTSRALLPMHNFLLHRFVDKLTVERSKLLWTFFPGPRAPGPVAPEVGLRPAFLGAWA